jgi:hypothetical protein
MRVAVVALLFVLTACVHTVSDRLFCGLSIADGGVVSQAELDAFIAEEVATRFPDGFTVWRAQGHWQGGNEESLVIEIVRPRDAQTDAKVRAIAEAYRKRFRQQAVLRVTMPARMELIR